MTKLLHTTRNYTQRYMGYMIIFSGSAAFVVGLAIGFQELAALGI